MDKEGLDKVVDDLTVIGRDDTSDASSLVEITALIRPDQAFALEILENAGRQQLGKDFDKDKLIQDALDLLIEKSLIAIRLGRNKLVKKDS